MKILRTLPRTFILILLLYLDNCTARNKRQIVFEDNTSNSLSSNCRTPDRKLGICIPLTSCPELIQTTSRNRLRQYFCGFEGHEPKVCCPQQITGPVPRPVYVTVTTTQRTTPRTVRTTVRTTPKTVRTTVRTTPRTVNTIRTTPMTRTTVRVPDDPRSGGGSSLISPNRSGISTTKPAFLPKSCGITMFTKSRIIGGGEADKGSWPWMTVVYVRKSNGDWSPDCGGALVTNQHVVTAAHCVVTGRYSRPLDPSRVSVRLGAHNLKINNEPESINVGVEDIRRHENFEPRTYKNDIAVLKLSRPVAFTKRISPVCLPYDSLRREDLTDKTAFVIGYGTTAFNGNASDVLMEASFDILSQEVCRRAYEPEVQFSRVYLCAGIMDGSKDACQGDSGGPLLTIGENSSYYLVGITSFGKQCGQPGYPGVYARVTEFLEWLTRNLSN